MKWHYFIISALPTWYPGINLPFVYVIGGLLVTIECLGTQLIVAYVYVIVWGLPVSSRHKEALRLLHRTELGLKAEEEIFDNTIGFVDGFRVHDDSEYWREKKRISF